MRRSLLIHHSPAAVDAGFLLPLSVAGALVLLLSSLVLSAAALQAQRLQGALRQRQQHSDQLVSAAHQLAAALQGSHHCLFTVPSNQWLAAQPMPLCATGVDPQALLDQPVGEGPVFLRAWQPDGTGRGGEIRLQLGEHGPERRYGFSLVPGQGLREVS